MSLLHLQDRGEWKASEETAEGSFSPGGQIGWLAPGGHGCITGGGATEKAGTRSKNNQAWHPEPHFLLCWVTHGRHKAAGGGMSRREGQYPKSNSLTPFERTRAALRLFWFFSHLNKPHASSRSGAKEKEVSLVRP